MISAFRCRSLWWLLVVSLTSGCGQSSSSIEGAIADDAAVDAASPPQDRDSVDSEALGPPRSLTYPLEAPGPYRVGHRVMEVTYTPVATGASRTIPLQVWYPTEDTEGDAVLYLDAFTDEDALGNATLAPSVDGAPFPVHIHTHGNLGWGGLADHVASRFVSHGWVVVAPDHLGNTLVDNVRDGDVPAWVWPVRVEDVGASLDHLASLPEADPLSDQLDVDHVLLSGHSYGGAAAFWLSGATLSAARVDTLCGANDGCTEAEGDAFALKQPDARIAAVLSMAPGDSDLFTGVGLNSLSVPLLHMTDDDDRPEDNAAYWTQAPTGSLRLHMTGACHTTYTLGGCPGFDTELGLQIVNTYALAFARHLLLGDQDPETLALLDGRRIIDASSELLVKAE